MKYIIIGIVILIPCILDRIYIKGQHFDGVYGIPFGAYFLYKGYLELKNKNKHKNKETTKSVSDIGNLGERVDNIASEPDGENSGDLR